MIDRALPYQIATNIFKQGMECDNAARLIRRQLPFFLQSIRNQVIDRMGKDYKKEWEYEDQFEYTP